MYYVFVKETDNKLAELTGFVHAKFKDELSPSKLAKAIEMDERPDPLDKEGQYVITYLNKETVEYEYKYFPIPEPEETKVEKLEKEVAELNQVVKDMILLSIDDSNSDSDFDL